MFYVTRDAGDTAAGIAALLVFIVISCFSFGLVIFAPPDAKDLRLLILFLLLIDGALLAVVAEYYKVTLALVTIAAGLCWDYYQIGRIVEDPQHVLLYDRIVFIGAGVVAISKGLKDVFEYVPKKKSEDAGKRDGGQPAAN